MTIKTLHVIPAIAARYGGTSNVIVSMVAALNHLPGIEAEIATTDADGQGHRLSTSDLPKGLPIHLFSRTWSEQWKLSLGLKQWMSRNAARYDLIDIHAVWSFTTATAARAAECNDVPYTVRPAGMLSGYTWQHSAWKKRLYWELFERRTILNASGFHVTSEEEAAEVQALRADARTFVIPNGVDAEAFAYPRDPDALRRRCGPAAGDLPILLFLSRLHHKKGIVERLLPAFAALRTSCFLAIVGDKDPHTPEYEGRVRREIAKLGLQSRVAMLGAVNRSERWAMFDGATMFVLPSYAENFGIVVAEAMARSCPVVVTKEVQSGALVNQARGGTVVDGDVAEFAAAIDALMENEAERVAAGVRGREFANQHLQWSSIAQRLKAMYDAILAGTAVK